MKPIDKRERLFRTSRPQVRELHLLNGNEYHKDIKILYVAHKHKPFYGVPPDMTESQFVEFIKAFPTELMIVEDYNPQYEGVGPVALIAMSNDGWKYEPHVEFFPWASKRNILRTAVSFFQFLRSSRKVGCVVVYSQFETKQLFDKSCTYGVLQYVGKIVNGDPRGDEYIYSVKGKKR